MEPKDYATIRTILKQEQGEKIAPYVFRGQKRTLSRDDEETKPNKKRMLEENTNEQPRTSQKRSLEEDDYQTESQKRPRVNNTNYEETSAKRKRNFEDKDIEEKNEEPRKKRRFDDE